MAIFQLRSLNPRFSFVVQKNPLSGMLLKNVRKGKAFGWFSDDHTYNVYFKDGDNEVSYPKEKEEPFEYLNVSRYNTPLFPLNAVSDYFNSASKKLHEVDLPGLENEIMVNLVHIENKRYLAFFRHHFPDFQLEWEELAHQNYRITIKTQKTIYELLNYSNSLFLFLSLMNRNNLFDMTDDTIEKYIRNLNVIDAPFFIRYLFARNVLTKKDRFRRFKVSLEETSQYEIDFAFGNTATQRKDWITHHLKFELPIIDIGCGEGAYTIPYSKKIAPLFVHAIDIDEGAREKVRQKALRQEIDTIILYDTLDHFLDNELEEKVDVLLTEVVEHMSEEEAAELITKVVQKLNVNKLFLTTPNRDFNQFYQIDLRHDDHKWEMDEVEFKAWLGTIIPADGWDLFYQGIGDKVNGIHTTQGVIISRKEATTR
jgi:small RNA 2'-O-methyltransferase